MTVNCILASLIAVVTCG